MSYTDTYLTGDPALIDDVLQLNADEILAVLGPSILDGIGHACVRCAADAEQLVMPPEALATLEDLTRYPETARLVVGVFMPDPEEPPPDTVEGGTDPEPPPDPEEPPPEPEEPPPDTVEGGEVP